MRSDLLVSKIPLAAVGTREEGEKPVRLPRGKGGWLVLDKDGGIE